MAGYSMPKAYGFSGRSKIGGGGLVGGLGGAGALEGLGFSGDITFSPSLYLVTKGIREATTRRSMKAPLWEAINRVMIPSIEKNFNAQGRPVKWPKLSHYTKMIRQRQGFSAGPILQRSKRLKSSALAKARWQVDGMQGRAVYGNFPATVQYAGIMQAGLAGSKFSVGAGAHIPARPFAIIQSQDFDKISKVFEDWMMSNLLKKIPKGRR